MTSVTPRQQLKNRLLSTIDSETQALIQELEEQTRVHLSDLSQLELKALLVKNFESSAYKIGQSVITWFKAIAAFRDPLDGESDSETTQQARDQLVRHLETLRDWFIQQDPSLEIQDDFLEILRFLEISLDNELSLTTRRTSNSVAVKPRIGSIVPTNSSDLRILFMASDPVPKNEVLRLNDEVRIIGEKLDRGSHRDQIWFDHKWAVRLEDVTTSINRFRPKIVHLSGHGDEAAGFVFLDDQGNTNLATGRSLRRMFLGFSNDVQLVVLCCCHSAKHAEELSQVIDFTIGFDCSVSDSTAIDFSSELYGALSFGRNLIEAFNQALGLLEAKNAICLPKLFMKKGTTESAGTFIKAKDVLSFDALVRSLNTLASDLFIDGRRKLKIILDTAESLIASQGLDEDVPTKQAEIFRATSELEGLISLIARSVERIGLIENTWQALISVEAGSKLRSLGARCVDLRLEILKHSQPYSIFLHATTTRMNATPIGDYRTPLLHYAELLRELVKLQITSLSLISIEFDVMAQCLPSIAIPSIKRQNWQWREMEPK